MFNYPVLGSVDVAVAAAAVVVAVAVAFAVTVAVADTFGIPAALRQMAIR